jgi:hypothetical protein
MAGPLTLEDVRRLALALPGAVEMDHHGAPSFRVGGKIFSTVRPDGSRLMVKLGPEDQYNLCEAHPEAMTPVPGYWGRKGATYVALERVGEELAEMLLRLAWQGIAPANLRRI